MATFIDDLLKGNFSDAFSFLSPSDLDEKKIKDLTKEEIDLLMQNLPVSAEERGSSLIRGLQSGIQPTDEEPPTEEPSFDFKDALSSLGSQGGRPQSLGSTSPRSGPAVPQGSTRFSPTPEPIQYGVPLEVLTNIQLRAQTEAYLRNLYDQAMRERIRRPNVISLI